MPDKTNDTVIATVMEQLIAEGPQAMAQIITALMNLAMRMEREQFLGAGHYERAVDRRGYSFGPHRFRKDGHWYLGASPSKTSVQRLKTKVRDLLVPGRQGAWPEVRDQLNRLLRSWSAYFSHGTRLPAYRAIDNHVQARVRGFLCRRHKVPTRGTRRFPAAVVFGELGVLQLRRVHLGATS